MRGVTQGSADDAAEITEATEEADRDNLLQQRRFRMDTERSDMVGEDYETAARSSKPGEVPQMDSRVPGKCEGARGQDVQAA